MGDDYELSFSFPGSIKAIVRLKDWDKNAYVEFSGFKNKVEQYQGLKDLKQKIKKALGDQLYAWQNPNADETGYWAFSIRNEEGFFSMNMELLAGTTGEPIYLLGPEREEENLKKNHVILLKIYGGIPRYHHFISDVESPDRALGQVIKTVVDAARKDFVSLQTADTTGMIRRLPRYDSIRLNNIEILMHYRGSHYSASIYFIQQKDSLKNIGHWNYYQLVLKATLGPEFVFYEYEIQGEHHIVYYKRAYDPDAPRIYLEQEEQNGKWVIKIKIMSNQVHPTKRALNPADDE